MSAGSSRCLAVSETGNRCMLGTGHDHPKHLWASDAYKLGSLQASVTLFLAGAVDREFLARKLAETERAS